MAKVKGNSFEAREKKAKKRSSIVKMSELREETMQSIPVEKPEEVKSSVEIVKHSTVVQSQDGTALHAKEEVKPTVEVAKLAVEIVTPVEEKREDANISQIELEEEVTQPIPSAPINIDIVPTKETIKPVTVKEEVVIKENDGDDFFNLNIKNDVFEGKITTVRVYDDILETLKKYAGMKNYPIIEFTNKVITLGLDDLDLFDMLQISEIKFKNNTSRSIMYNLTDVMEEKLNKYIKGMNKKGYKISRNVILNVILNETLKKFYV